ncbi:hypothetical protein [Simkania sp.]|uniref:hypothetical protein n=1 Tax=Simkania sp. TaxID=34094 RepID=UPI003B527045
MSTVPPTDSSKTESSRRIVYYYPNQPLRTNINQTISTISSYVPESQPLSWLKIPLEWFRSLINSFFSFFAKKPEKNIAPEKPPESKKDSITPPPSLDLANRGVLQTIFEETKKALDEGFYFLPDKTKVTLNLEPMKKSTKVWTHDALSNAIDLTGRPT